MIKREISRLVKERLLKYPAVVIVGPRQSGKTTLAKNLGGLYFDLEQDADRLRLDLEWNSIAKGEKLLILDEAQSWPRIFPLLRGTIDADKTRMGRFLLLGSVSPSLMVHVSESLAGRLSLIELTPFLISELQNVPVSKRWLFGGYPQGGILDASRFPQWQTDYVDLIVQRDLPNWGLPSKPKTTFRLFKMISAVHGQLWNASQIGQSMGLSYATINSYMDYLENAFLVRRISPYLPNLRKRLVKSPKFYWRDSGVLHALLHVGTYNDLLNMPWVGASWEGFVIEQILGSLSCRGKSFEAFFLRTSDQYEIDLVLDFGSRLWAVEIKLTSNPTISDSARLNKTADLIKADKRILISQSDNIVSEGGKTMCSLPWFLEHLD